MLGCLCFVATLDPFQGQMNLLRSAVGIASDYRSRGHKFESQLCHITLVETDIEIISIVILLSYHCFKKGSCQLAKVCVHVLVNCLED